MNTNGSPPPMRGKALNFRHTVKKIGITPAYAGKRKSTPKTATCRKDHPRLCGEKLDKSAGMVYNIGSPPPMRGKADPELRQTPSGGITPAYAGKSDSGGDMYPQRRDHPRLCGEKAWDIHSAPCLPGSPPPMRGKGNQNRFDDVCFGITPAYAGKRGYL